MDQTGLDLLQPAMTGSCHVCTGLNRFKLVATGLNGFLQYNRFLQCLNRFELVYPVPTGYNRILQCLNCFLVGLNWFKPVATGYNRFLQCLNWVEQVYTGLNRLHLGTPGCCNI